jgi:hypothetical protein
MQSDMWLILAIFCFVIEAVIWGVTFRNDAAGRYGGFLLPLGLAFFAISFLSMTTRSV